MFAEIGRTGNYVQPRYLLFALVDINATISPRRSKGTYGTEVVERPPSRALFKAAKNIAISCDCVVFFFFTKTVGLMLAHTCTDSVVFADSILDRFINQLFR